MTKAPLLITGFGPFAHYRQNPSGLAAALFGELYGDDAKAIVLPVDYWSARTEILQALDETKPEICILLGQAPRPEIWIETKARKPLQYAALAGADVYYASKEDARDICASSELIHLSGDAGEYICEAVFWTVLDYRNQFSYPNEVMFIHIPAITEEWPFSRTLSLLKEHIINRCFRKIFFCNDPFSS